jgi:hypothetical protein
MKWNPELIRNTPRIVCCVQRATTLPACINAIGSRVEAHPDADNVMALLHEEGSSKRRVDAARERDEDALPCARYRSGDPALREH